MLPSSPRQSPAVHVGGGIHGSKHGKMPDYTTSSYPIRGEVLAVLAVPSYLTRHIVQVLTEVLHGHIEDSSDDLPAARFISRATPFGSATSTCFATPLRSLRTW